MRRRRLLLALAVVAAGFGLVPAQNYAPPPANLPDEAARKEIAARADLLARRLGDLRRQGVRDPYLADAEIFFKAAQWVVRHGEFYAKDSAAKMLDVLDRGLLRCSQLGRGEAPWQEQTGQTTARAYRSRVDNSLQPYAVTLPADYGKDKARRWRLDVVLHGRDASLTEVKFLHAHGNGAPAPKDDDFVRLDVYGRGNNAYRWAGETDVSEALDHFRAVERLLGREGLIDPTRLVLRGFSMGGAGTWQLGLRHPDRWCVLGPGAGFVTTRGYLKNLPEKLPSYQEACLHIYDAVDYAENAFNVPVVAYSGAEDAQKAAADTMEAALKKLDIPMTHLVAPGLAHQFPAEWRKKAEAEYAKHVAKGREEYPKRVRFVTYTLKSSQCEWVALGALERHYDRASVDAERTETGFNVKTANVRVLDVTLPQGNLRQPVPVTIDGQKLEPTPYLSSRGVQTITLQKRGGQWGEVWPEKVLTEFARRPCKNQALHGPIDEAFGGAFLCVRGTGKPWHEATGRYAEENLNRFRAEWSQFLRGDLPVKDDTDVTPEDVANRHLILFGDPASNSLLAQTVDALPLTWTKDQIVFAGQTVSAAEHVPVLIYPSPLNGSKYVVLNSGHTFHAADFRGTNALLYPRLGDFALLKLAATKNDPLANEVIVAGLFDDFWRTEK